MNTKTMDYYEDFYFSLIKFQYKYYRNILVNKNKVLYKDIGFPQEIILSAGFMPAVVESLMGMLPPSTVHEEVLDRANKYFYDTGNCSFHRLALPAIDNHLISLPEAIVGLSACQEVVNHFFVLSKRYKIPFYAVDLPYDRTESSLEFLANQYEEVYCRLCKLSGISSGSSRLSEVIHLSNQAAEFFDKANALRKAFPCLLYGSQMLKFVNLIMLFGTEGAIDVAKEYYETCEKYAREDRKVPCKCKLLWCNMGINYDAKFFEYIEKELGAVIAFEEINSMSLEKIDLENPFRGLAQKSMNTHFIGDVELRAQNLMQLINDCQIDGIIFFSHMNCRLFNSKFSLLKQLLSRTEIPMVELTGDCIDQRSYNRAQLMTRVEAFIEMIIK